MPSSGPITALGAISGTSMDGIDLAVIETDGRDHVVLGAGETRFYPSDLREKLGAIIADPSIAERDPLTTLEDAVTDAFTAAIRDFTHGAGIDLNRIDVIGLHGQTVCHRPERRFTRQLGDGERMADALGVPVVDGFRLADVASGGHGAPFAPLYHAALARDLAQPVVVLNLGGVGNVTYIDGDTVIAFDTGPASAIIDDYVSTHFGLPFDDGGRIAARGTVNETVLAQLMDNPFFAEQPPKSLDRQDFHDRAEAVDGLDKTDAVATLAAFTVAATAAALDHMPGKPRRWLVTGGGRHNQAFMAGLHDTLGVPVEPVESSGWRGDLIEAEAFAYLAVRSLRDLPLSVPSTTGVPEPMLGGRLWPAPAHAVD